MGFLLWFSLTAGLQDGGVRIDYRQYDLPPIAISIDVHAENSWLDIYGIYQSSMSRSPHVSWQFWPEHDSYTVGARATFGQLSIAAEHRCEHPVDPYGLNTSKQYDLWYTKIEATIRSKP